MDYSTTPANELAALCARGGSEAAWREFVRRFQPKIAIAILRTARGSKQPTVAQVDDLVQEVFLALCANNCRVLRGFVPQGTESIVGFLTKVAQRHAIDHFRAETSQKRGGNLHRVESLEGDIFDLLPAPAHQATSIERERQLAEFDLRLRKFPPGVVGERELTIFWLYYRQGYTALQIGKMKVFRLTDKGVESLIHRLTKLLRDSYGGDGAASSPAAPSPPKPPKGNFPPATIWEEGR